MKIPVDRLREKDGFFFWETEIVKVDPEGDFKINEDNVNEELCRIGLLLCFYGDIASDLEVKKMRMQDELELTLAEISTSLRGTMSKYTETQLKQKAIVDARYKTQLDKLRLAQLYSEKFKLWLKSMQKKVDALIALAYKQREEIKKVY